MDNNQDRPRMEVHEDVLWARLGRLNFEKDLLIKQRDSLVLEVVALKERVRELEALLASEMKTNVRGKKPTGEKLSAE